MEHLNQVIASNLKKIRDQKKLSLDKVAALTGVSKSMLGGQIERGGESNPTITTVWKIANGLKVSFSALIKEPQTDNKVVTREDVDPMIEDHGKFRLFSMFPYGDNQKFEIFIADMDKGAYIQGITHGEGSYEIVTVTQGGELTMRVEEEDVILSEGSGLRFKANKEHTYHNTNNGMTRLQITIYYSER